MTVQLPLFNEMYVAGRLIDAVAKLDWPRDRLEIQILDDSTDETVELCRAKAEELLATGLDVKYLHRRDREGFKAGALAAGLARAPGQFILVLDADFVPPTDLLRQTIGHFDDPEVGMVQVRWEHLNRESSVLTRIQALLLDGHFVVEQTVRARTERFFNFNGTAGLWRREAISEAGGWQHDTLTEDLDLSYRAQLAGWKAVFADDIEVPTELPASVRSFKVQ
ncbi:MAG: glycosyltransferase, partial [Actinomycetia bacterium]|nr:glycosyltransferase [Actinomycetes bacterium]